MSKIFCNALNLSLAILSTTFILSYRTGSETAIAFELPLDQTVRTGGGEYDAAIADNLIPTQFDTMTNATADPMGQVNSVFQLSDVQPTDWAFQALQNLVERYGCIEGYPDRTFRGNRAMTRYEFAAGLNACLDTITQLIKSSTQNLTAQEDLATLNRLLQEFQAELTALRGRIDSLEARLPRIEAQQFSTTTKLNGLLTWGINAGTIQGESEERLEPNPTFFSYLLLNFRTSFTGKDLLLTQLFAGTSAIVGEASNLTPAILSFLDYSGVDNDIRIRRLRYTFPISDDLRATIFARGNITDFVDYNSYANDSSLDFSTFTFLYNLLLVAGDATASGVVLTWNPGQGPLTLKAVYRADAAADPNPRTTDVFFSVRSRAGRDRRGGLFGDPNLAVFEAEFIPSKSFALRLNYSVGSQGGDGYSAIGANFEFVPVKGIALFGRFAHAFDYSDAIGVGVTDDNATPTPGWLGYLSQTCLKRAMGQELLWVCHLLKTQ